MKVFSGYAKTILVTTAEIEVDFEFFSKYKSQNSKVLESVFFPLSMKLFKIVVAFDNDEKKIGTEIYGITVEDIKDAEKIIKTKDITICILAIPVSETNKVANKLTNMGINAILSFSPCQINMPKNIKVKCVDLSTELAR